MIEPANKLYDFIRDEHMIVAVEEYLRSKVDEEVLKIVYSGKELSGRDIDSIMKNVFMSVMQDHRRSKPQ